MHAVGDSEHGYNADKNDCSFGVRLVDCRNVMIAESSFVLRSRMT